MLVVFWGVSQILVETYPRTGRELRSSLRWMFRSRKYKAELLAQPALPGRQYRHLKWDSWGIMTAGTTTAYLIVDPENALAPAVRGNWAPVSLDYPTESPTCNDGRILDTP